MKQFFLVWIAVTLSLCTVLAAAVVKESPAPLYPGERLHLSLQNEVDAAVVRAARWLKTVQHPDGYWADSNRLATAFAVLALQQADISAAMATRGREWLRQTAGSTSNTFWTALATGEEMPLPPASCIPPVDQPYTLDTGGFSRLSGAQAFLLAEINRAIPAGLVVVPQGWRERLAAKVVASQHYEPDIPGTGFWPACGTGPEAAAEAQTALAILILLQL